MPSGAVLEVAPGPGFLAVEIARLGRFQVTGLDISHTRVEIAKENATAAGVAVDFRQGDANEMPFADRSFDLIVSQAAFKNFRRPVSALNELHRVLRTGGWAVIQDLRKEASRADIDREVDGQKVGAVNGSSPSGSWPGSETAHIPPATLKAWSPRAISGHARSRLTGSRWRSALRDVSPKGKGEQLVDRPAVVCDLSVLGGEEAAAWADEEFRG